VSAERGAECTRRGVADAFGDFANPDIFPAEQVFRDRHSPGEQIFHRRQADRAREALEER